MYRYNIHDLVIVDSNAPIESWNYFAKPASSPMADLVVEYSQKRPSLGSGVSSGRNFAFSRDDDTFSFRESWLGAPVIFVLERLSSANEKIHLTVYDPYRKLLRVRPPRFSVDHLLRALLQIILIRKGLTLTHAACVQNRRSRSGILLAGPSFTGKTTTVLALARSGEYDYLSDDMTIVRPDGTALAYPTPVNVSYAMIKGFAKAAGAWNLKARYGDTLGRILPEPLAYRRSWAQVEKRVSVSSSAELETICLMVPGQDRIKEVDADLALRKLLLLDNGELFFFEHPLFLFYSYVKSTMDISELRHEHERILGSAVSRAKRLVSISAIGPAAYPGLIRELAR